MVLFWIINVNIKSPIAFKLMCVCQVLQTSVKWLFWLGVHVDVILRTEKEVEAKKKKNRLMNSVHSLSAYICMKEKLFTYYKIRMAPLILFTTRVILSACKIYWLFCE